MKKLLLLVWLWIGTHPAQQNPEQINNDRLAYEAYIRPVKDKIKHQQTTHHATTSKNDALIDSLKSQEDRLNTQWVEAHPNSISSLSAVISLDPYKHYEKVKHLFDGLSSDVRRSDKGLRYLKIIEKYNTVELGADTPEISMPDPRGNNTALSSYRGKYVLVDFWASWCVPCRHQNPGLVASYRKFRNKGFNIVGVSLDKDKGAWISAIQHDGLSWPQVSDLQFWDNAAARAYRVRGIPQNFLIGPDGKIVAKNLFDKDLDRELEKLLDNRIASR